MQLLGGGPFNPLGTPCTRCAHGDRPSLGREVRVGRGGALQNDHRVTPHTAHAVRKGVPPGFPDRPNGPNQGSGVVWGTSTTSVAKASPHLHDNIMALTSSGLSRDPLWSTSMNLKTVRSCCCWRVSSSSTSTAASSLANERGFGLPLLESSY